MDSDGGILKIGADADLQVTHSGSAGTITNATGDLTLDVAGGIILDAATGVISLHEAGNGVFGTLTRASGSLSIKSEVSDADIFLKGNDGGSTITALTLDMSQAGRATFNEGIVLKSSTGGDFGVNINTASGDSMKLQVVDTGTAGAANGVITVSDGDLQLNASGGVVVNESGADADFRVESNSNTHALFVDAGSNNVGINTSATASTLAELTVGKAGDFPVLKISRTDASYTSGVLALGDGNSTSVNVAVWRGTLNDYSAGGNYLNLHGYQGVSIASANAAAGSGVMGVFVSPSATVINDDGGDYDFRVESDSNTHMLFVDAGGDYVSVGTAGNLNGKLNVSGSIVATNGQAVDPDALSAGNVALGQIADGSGWGAVGLGWKGSGAGDTAAIGYAGENLYFAMGDGTNADSFATVFKLGRNEIVVNEDSNDIDFRVESDGNANAFFVDAQYSRIGINNGSPSWAFDAQAGAAGQVGTFYDSGSNGGSMYNGAAVLSVSRRSNGSTSLNGELFRVGRDNSDSSSYNVSESIFTVRSDSIVVNESGTSNIDFRVESDSNTHMLFVDAGNECVIVSNNSPSDTAFNVGGAKNYTGNYAGTIVDALTADFSGQPNANSSFVRIGSGRYANYGGTDTGIIFQPSGANNGYYPRILQTCHRGNNATSEGRMRWFRLRQDADTEIGLYEMNSAGFLPLLDNTYDLGASGNRFADVYATNGTINTSDASLKEQVTDLSAAELQAATACKALIKKYKWISSVAEKGDDARWHIGVIAQDVQQAFTDAGLNADDYGLFIRERWWTFTYNGQEERTTRVEEIHVPMEEATEHTRLGVRYNELLAFIIAAL